MGSTYDWKDESYEPTIQAKEELLVKLKTVIKTSFKVIEHKVGIRPTTKDRRPIIGTHPEHKNIHVFNGLGAKGVMIAPYYVKQFVDNLEGKSVLDKEVDLKRCKKKSD